MVVHDEVEASLGLVNVSEHLERDKVVVMDDLVVWVFGVYAE